MSQTAAPGDLERRKQVRLRLRPDVQIEVQRYEGRTYYVIKDPVSLRYYRIKEYEKFLLGFFNGRNTLEEAQEAYEDEYRPDRLRFEDLEAFAQQLLLAGLVQNENPHAGDQLYERRNKRSRKELLQKFTNILYIKIPIFDPERILTKMIPYTRWIFTRWFFTLSVLFMLSAALLVASNFTMFRNKLPNYHEFFQFKTLVYLWGALAIVKVIHEFGHGLSCKRFNGEVHEMGLLFLCLSPAMYCNVTDAWKLPNKWHRIIISAAGIYVELLIATIATFVWWNTPNDPFVNNMALSMMVVCSVSTFAFNANPLMRFDGYYVLADWLEIPNLRERSNRFLSQTALKHCLGVEVRQEGYMALWRRILFICYAILSWCYRWFITFAILGFLYHFLRPYKLEVISFLLTLMALGTLLGVPAYRLVANIHKRGRLPDMVRWRVIMSSCVVAGVILFIFFVPVPISRIRGVGLVQASPDASEMVRTRIGATLDRLLVRNGTWVKEGDELAHFSNLDLSFQLGQAEVEHDNKRKLLDYLQSQKNQTTDEATILKINLEMSKTINEIQTAAEKIIAIRTLVQDDLILRAPRDGYVTGVPSTEAVGRFIEKDTEFCTVMERGSYRVVLPVIPPEWQRLRENADPNESVLPVTLRIQGRGEATWQAKLLPLPESEASEIPQELSTRSGGPIAVNAGSAKPQTQQYLVYLEILQPDKAIMPGQLAQVKISCKPETCARWVWRKLNDMFDIGLI